MLSVIILTKNSEKMIADCISNIASIADEILVIDSQSQDRTKEVAEMQGAKVYIQEFRNFADQRNFAMSKAKGKWVLYLDSDEFASKAFCREVENVIKSYDQKSKIAGYFIHRKTYYFGKDWGMTDQVQRLFIKEKFVEWYGVVHETPKVKGEFGIIDAPIHHFTHQNLSQMLSKTIKWSDYEAQLRFNANHPQMTPLRFMRIMATGFFDAYIKGKGYKNGTEGFIESLYQGFSMFVTYAKLWELQQKREKN